MNTTNGAVIITKTDRDRLEQAIWPSGKKSDRGLPWHMTALEKELNRASVVDPKRVPPDIVTMNSTVQVRGAGDESDVYTIVYPDETDIDAGRVSVLAPMGLALLGARVGEVVRLETPAGPRRYTVEKILFQPESAQRWDL